jgi:hypothetical protein
MLGLVEAESQHQGSVKNWMDGTKPIVRSEASWVMQLLESDDFVALKSKETDKAGLESLLERILKKWPRLFSKVCL